MLGLKRVVVTGASRGIGYELVRLLLNAGGFEVVGTSRAWEDSKSSLASLTSLAASTQSGGGRRPSTFSPLTLDVGDSDSRLGFPRALAGVLRNSKLHVLVNNAGLFPSPSGRWSEEAFRGLLASNAVGPLRLAEDLRQFAADDFHVVNVTSGLGRLALVRPPYRAALEACRSLQDLEALPYVEAYGAEAPQGSAPAYSLSKAALNRGTRLLAEAWGGAARVSAVDPGWCATAMGGPSAPRKPAEGALSVLHMVLSSADTVGTGKVHTSKGQVVEP
jgi:NAD(P)-dependent dehydrogenase (short-subunit alcohol dehydrogenase family)